MKNNLESKNDLFQYWLMEMGDKLDGFIDEMPDKLILDYSPKSLLRLEDWILSRYPAVGNILRETEKSRLDSLARYVGQVYRKNLNGKWKLFLDDPDNVFYELPVVMVLGLDPICPLSEITASVDRRRGDYLYDLFQKRARRLNKDIK